MNKPRSRRAAQKPIAPQLTTEGEKNKLWAWVTLTISVLALLVAIWAANETRQTRLDGRRLQLRSEMLSLMDEAQSTANLMDCYILADTNLEEKDKDKLKARLRDGHREYQHTIRVRIVELADAPPDRLSKYVDFLSGSKGQFRRIFDKTMNEFRNSWSKELREHADAICKP